MYSERLKPANANQVYGKEVVLRATEMGGMDGKLSTPTIPITYRRHFADIVLHNK